MDNDALAQSLIELGDWFQIKHQPEKALSYYRRAAALSPQPTVAAPSSKPPPLSFPVIVYYPTPQRASRHVALPAEQVDETFVEVQFTVTEAGDVEEEDDAEDLLQVEGRGFGRVCG